MLFLFACKDGWHHVCRNVPDSMFIAVGDALMLFLIRIDYNNIFNKKRKDFIDEKILKIYKKQ